MRGSGNQWQEPQLWLEQLPQPVEPEAATNLDPLLKLKAETFLLTFPPWHFGHLILVELLKTICSKSS
jgi:hypothetical protein